MLTKPNAAMLPADADAEMTANSDLLLPTQKAAKANAAAVAAAVAAQKLDAARNLDDLASQSTALINLGLGNATTTLGVSSGTVQHFVVSDTLSPQFHQSRRKDPSVSDGDVTTGTVLAKWDSSGWLNGARRFASRFTWYVASAVGSVVRGVGKINVTNAAGVDWAAFTFSADGRLGIGDETAFTENPPKCALDAAGQVAGRLYGHNVRADVAISSGAITVTGYGYVRVTAAGTITDIVSADENSYAQEVIVTALSGTVMVTHNASKIRCRGGVDQAIVANQGGLKFKHVPNSTIWEQIG